MDTPELDRIRASALALLKPHGLKRLAVFGSGARGDATPDSDLDLLVRFEEPVGLFALARLKRELTERLGREVHLVTEGALSHHLRPAVEREMVVLYEA